MKLDEKRLKIIAFCYHALKEFRGTTYEYDIRKIVDKYFQYEVSELEVISDISYLKNLKEILKSRK